MWSRSLAFELEHFDAHGAHGMHAAAATVVVVETCAQTLRHAEQTSERACISNDTRFAIWIFLLWVSAVKKFKVIKQLRPSTPFDGDAASVCVGQGNGGRL